MDGRPRAPGAPLTEPGEGAFRRALEHHQAGRLDEAERAYRESLAEEPGRLAAHNNLGNVLRSAGRLAEAEACFREALALDPEFVEALFNLGATLQSLGRQQEASACFEQVLKLLLSTAYALSQERRFAEAADCYARALELQPDNAAVLVQAGAVLDALHRQDEALQHLRKAVALQPEDADAWFNLGIVLQGRNEFAAAIEAYDTALRITPENGEAALARALSRLSAGDYARGWPEYEVRHTGRFEYPRVVRPDLAMPMWRGEPLQGKRILLVGEQGFGDQIQFVRYAAVLAARGAVVDVAVDQRLLRLLQSAPGVRSALVAIQRDAFEYDYWSLLMSVPLHVGTRVENVPAPIPYLKAPAAETDKWRERLRALPAGSLKVGLIWAGRDRRNVRTMQFSDLLPLAQVRGVGFVGMQFGETAAEPGAPAGFPRLQLGPEIGDFADHAALLANLDLLVSADTAAVHVAAALGKPVWVLSPSNADWRWMAEREDSPWYPTVKLYRQRQRGDWAPVVARVARDLQALAARPA